MNLSSLSRRRLAVAAATASLMLFALFAPLPVLSAQPRARTIDIDARLFAYEPSIIRVNRGDTVTLHLQSLDAEHGLYIDGYEVNINAEPGRSSQATFVAQRAGAFKMRCSVTCGALHPFMIGQLRVDPDLPLARVAALTLIVTIGAVIYFWRGESAP
jgi:heme/copper-type cytochrome/quinol oxidase subunit 2